MVNYTFRKSILSNAETWELTPDGISFIQQGIVYFVCPYRNISCVRLAYFPTNYKTNNFYCELTITAPFSQVLRISSVTYRGVADFADQRDTYNPFVVNLIVAIADSNPHCRFLAGSKKWKYIGNQLLVLFIVAMLFALFSLIGSLSVTTFIFIKLLLVVYYLYYLIRSATINFPGRFDPKNIPSKLLPA